MTPIDKAMRALALPIAAAVLAGSGSSGSAAIACGRSNPWVSEMTPTVMVLAAGIRHGM